LLSDSSISFPFLVSFKSSSFFNDLDLADGKRNKEIAATNTIVESSIAGKRSFHNKPLVIHAIAVAIKIQATIFSSLLNFPKLSL
jgi:hypothetical protein